RSGRSRSAGLRSATHAPPLSRGPPTCLLPQLHACCYRWQDRSDMATSQLGMWTFDRFTMQMHDKQTRTVTSAAGRIGMALIDYSPRHGRILTLLAEHGTIAVNELARLLEV